MELLALSIGIGLAVSVLFVELFGLAAGGMIVPGYVALHLNQPLAVVTTLLVSIATFALVHSLSSLVIIYGRRRTVLMILVGYILGILVKGVGGQIALTGGADATVIGFIIPGLIAIWLDRQGIVMTITSMLTAATVVRLILILFFGEALQTS